MIDKIMGILSASTFESYSANFWAVWMLLKPANVLHITSLHGDWWGKANIPINDDNVNGYYAKVVDGFKTCFHSHSEAFKELFDRKIYSNFSGTDERYRNLQPNLRVNKYFLALMQASPLERCQFWLSWIDIVIEINGSNPGHIDILEELSALFDLQKRMEVILPRMRALVEARRR